MYKIKYAYFFVPFFLFFIGQSFAQINTRAKRSNEVTQTVLSDSSQVAADSLLRQDSVKIQKSSLETKVDYTADDFIEMDNTQKKIYLTTNAKVTYGNIKLEADSIFIDFDKKTMFAIGRPDSTGTIIGKPIFEQAGQVYYTDEIKYNFETEKAYIKFAITEQDEGFLRGDKVKKDSLGAVNLGDAMYTTCDLPYPHWHISAKKIKVLPGKRIVTGPFNLYFNGIPTPAGLPLGFLPPKKEKASGIIFPTYGEERVRGLFLRDFGYYFAFNDYIHTGIRGEIYSKGGYGASIQTNYMKRYRYNGNFSFDYNRFVSGQEELNPLAINDFWLRWSHTPQTRGTARFSASVNAGTSTYNTNQNFQNDFARNINSEFSSSVNYSNVIQGTPFSFSTSFRHSQNVRTREVQVQLPDVAVNMNRQTPFQNSNLDILKRLNLAWNFVATNRISNAVKTRSAGFPVANTFVPIDTLTGQPLEVRPFDAANLPLIFREAQNGARHTVPVSTSFNLLKHFNISPSFNYTELWYLKELDFSYDEEARAVRIDTLSGFSRGGFYNASANMTTRIYGFFNIRGKKIDRIRHVITPRVGFSYNPDFTDPSYGFFREVQIDSTGRTQMLSKYQNFVWGTAPAGESRSLTFGFDNNIELKIRTTSDTATEMKKVPIIKNLSFNSSYNFARDSFQLAPISMTAFTGLFNDKVSINMNATLNPYIYRLDSFFVNERTGVTTVQQTQLNQFAWNNGKGLGQITAASINMSTSLNPNSKTNNNPAAVNSAMNRQAAMEGMPVDPAMEAELRSMAMNPNAYIDWNVPWSLNLNYNLNYAKVGFQEARITQALNFSGDVSLTEKWKINFNSGFDFENRDLTQTNISIARDLHCWEMLVNWVPFGRYQSYSIDIRVKASMLQDLKISRRRSFFDFR